MEFLTTGAMDEWWGRRPDLLADHGRAPGPRLASQRIDLNFEARQCSAYAVALAIARWLLAKRDQVFVGVFEHGIWPSSENLHVYYAWRRACGDARTLEEAPGHVFREHELEKLATLLHLGFLFGWGLSCAAPAGDRAIHVDHDGHGLVVGPSASDLEDVMALASSH